MLGPFDPIYIGFTFPDHLMLILIEFDSVHLASII